MGSLLYRSGDGEWQILSQTGYENEDELQQLLAETPNLIPVDELAGQVEGPLMTIAREAALGSGLVDVLCLDQRGRPIVVEAKLRKNPEIRREVLAQAVSYAAHLEGLDTDEVVETIVRPWVLEVAGEIDEGTSLENCLEALGHGSPDGIADGLDHYLETGRFVIFIVVDEPHEQLRRTVSYVNAHADFDIYLVEVGYFWSEDGQQAISPRILDTSAHRARTGRAPSFDDALSDASQAVQEVDDRLVHLAEKLSLEVERTKGSRRIRTTDGTHLLSLSPRWESVQFTLAALRETGMTSEANEIAAGLGRMTEGKITPRSPTVSCDDLIRSWTYFENEFFPMYLQYRVKSDELRGEGS